jgi:hypothetical protein
MTSSEIAPTTGSAVEQFMSEFAGAPVGLEQVDSSDIVMSKITIEHELGLFKDSLTGQTYESLDTVLLGVIKGRVLWDTDLEAKDPLMCKSNDHEIGYPTAVFPKAAFEAKGGAWNPGGTIACESCPLAAWGSHPKDNKPWCSEQMTFPLTLGDAAQVGGTITFQRSALGPTRAYVSAFVRESKPMFLYRTLITLDRNKMGSKVYSVPKFVRGEAIEDLALLRSYAEQYTHIAEIWRKAPGDNDSTPAPAAAAPAGTTVLEGTVVSGEVGSSEPPF